MLWYHRERRRSQIQPDHLAAWPVFRLLVRGALQGELHVVALTLGVRALRFGAGCPATQQPGVLDAVREPVGRHRVAPVDQGRDAVGAPQQPPQVSLLGGLEHEAQSRIVALAFQAVEAAPPAAKAHAFRLAQAHPVDGPGARVARVCAVTASRWLASQVQLASFAKLCRA